MRAFVFTDPALARHAGRFVWLSIDTEKAQNAPFSKKYPLREWPSYYVIDPETETIVLRWVGAATVSQLEELFGQGERAVRGARTGAQKALAKADDLYGAGRYEESVPAYREALKQIPVGSSEYARAADSLLFSLKISHREAECVEFARAALPKLRRSPSAANLAGTGLGCALKWKRNASGRADAVMAFQAHARAIVSETRLPLSADDRSILYALLVDAREDAKDEEGARRIGREWVAYLDGAVAAVQTPEQRTALDPNRLIAYQAARELEKAIPMLERSEKDFPRDYNPPARLAFVYNKLKRYDESLAASDRALARVYGPRRIRVLLTRAEIHKGRGDAAAEEETLEEALRLTETLPPWQPSDSATDIASLRERREVPVIISP